MRAQLDTARVQQAAERTRRQLAETVHALNIDIDFLLEACHNLLVMNEEQDTCSFVHLSVQEYLELHVWKGN